jgi:hypothetical protein
MDGCVVWVRWTTPWYLGQYVGPGLSLWCFRRLLYFQECRSHSLTMASARVSVGLPSCLDRALVNRTCGFLAC